MHKPDGKKGTGKKGTGSLFLMFVAKEKGNRYLFSKGSGPATGLW